jgi:plasmid stability protein
VKQFKISLPDDVVEALRVQAAAEASSIAQVARTMIVKALRQGGAAQ